MYLCNDGHDEVCYESRNCPVCEQFKTISDLEDKVFELEEEIKKLNEEG